MSSREAEGQEGEEVLKPAHTRLCARCGGPIQGVTGKRLNNRKYCPACSPVAYQEQHLRCKHNAAAKAGVVVPKKAPAVTPRHRPQEDGERLVKTYKPGRRCPVCNTKLNSYTCGPMCDMCDRKKRLENLYTAKPPGRLHRVSGRITLENHNDNQR